MRISDWSSDVCSSDLLRIDFGDARRIALAAPIDGRLLPDRDPPEIEFVDARDQLVAARRIDLPDAFALLERLADLDRETRKLPRHGRAQVERIEVAPRDLEARFKPGRRRPLPPALARLAPFVGRQAVRHRA